MIENSIVYRNFKNKYQYFPLGKAEGSLIWNREGKRFIDFTSAWNVTNLGWNYPEVNEALIAQAKKNAQGLLWGSDPIQEAYAAVLTGALPCELDACVKETSGTESIEASIKVARTYTNRKKIIGFSSGYHGQLFASLALAYYPEELKKLVPLVGEISPLLFPHQDIGEEEYQKFLHDLENLLQKNDVAAIVTEPCIITGGGSTLVAYPGFLKSLRDLTKKYGTLLIVDEVGTGFSRTGKLFGIEHEAVVPDMVVFAKAISNGVAAIGTVVGKKDILESAFNDAVLISTFGWTPVACAAALKTLQVYMREKTWKMAAEKGVYIIKRLEKMIGGAIIGVRGKGLEIGIQFRDALTCHEVQRKAYADGLHVVVGSRNNMQLMPPLTIPMELLDEGLGILIKSFS